ncbi:uracil-DNA glycosylase domain protein [Bacteriovorax sp. BSW11_IV]|uniref:uracil-DNA glycosylase family protein n=1 Tax=Bacteriovorax sp. BSW11_IV TaxID=1353529 RepID=UPI00038A1A1A|nr:uracil-DNA glycosylase family protein [Bacteriovorax sp. BSW11_IV]EQC43600.1 uracil-DNA glycosylase domain protein [Bacteriovorax sp. BSW11_IV]
MKEMFADLLKNTRNIEEGRHPLNKTFEASLFNSSWYFPFKKELKVAPLGSSQTPAQPVTQTPVEKVIESAPKKALEKALEKVSEKAPEIVAQAPLLFTPKPKEEAPKAAQSFTCKEVGSFDEYLKSLRSDWSEDQVVGLSSFGNQCEIMFYGEGHFEDLSECEFPPLTFLASDKDLLGKMIMAMKLENGRFVRSSILGNKEEAIARFSKEVSFFRPKVVIALGASALNLILGRKERLSSVHGEFFSSKVDTDKGPVDFQIVPLFHPNFLEINPSMKRTAWIDMQKVMSYLKEQ